MADTRELETLRPSVFDRLIDEDPTSRDPEATKPRSVLVRELCAAVARDLSRLLNTRRHFGPLPDGLRRLHPLCLDFGLRDFSGADLSSEGARDELRLHMEQAIRRHEPRFERIAVELLRNSDPTDRTLRLRIDALLHADTVVEPIVFDSVVEPASGGVKVEGRFRE
jgi:type VI secretion system protein ImpF